MPVSTGDKLGPYEILAPIGAGGMGEIWKARDTRLGRTVAIKVAQERFSDRFGREARAISSLNHPNICTLYDVGPNYLVMEYVDGTHPIGPMPLKRAAELGGQILDALDAAHREGIVHRDLKPANILVTKMGVKVLDFGLAKFGPAVLGGEVPTSLTVEGAIAGTVHYMAPEQIEGRPDVDSRADIFAFGCVLYEMLTGDRAFDAPSTAGVLAAVLKSPAPSVEQAALNAVLQRCLAKDPDERWQTARDLKWQLTTAAASDKPPVREDTPAQTTQSAPAAEIPKRLSTGALASPQADANRYFENGLLSLIQYDITRMQKMLGRAVDIDRHFAEARAWLGFTHWLMIDSGYSYDRALLYQAEAEFRGVLQDDPDSAFAHSGMAVVFLFQGAVDLAIVELQSVLAAHPDHRESRHQMLCCHWIRGNYDEMEAIATDLFSRHPLFWPTRMDWGDALRSIGRYHEAIREQENVLEQDPRNPYARRFLARAQIAAGELSAARATLDLAPAAEQRGYWKIVSAILYAVEGKIAEALGEMDAEVLKYASFVLWYTAEAAVFYAVIGDVAAALEWLETAVRNGDERLEWFEHEPLFENLRGHPRFVQILEAVRYRRHLRRSS